MKISIDLDGTLFQNPDFYYELIGIFKITGHNVGVMSCHTKDDFPKIGGLDFWFTATGCENSLSEAESKAEIMIREKIDVSFDDKGLLIYEFCRKKGHPEKMCLCNWSYCTNDVIYKLIAKV
jgi:hypothetical protein